MAKAYKCDICGKYCDDIYEMSGISKPNLVYYEDIEGGNAEVCKQCLVKIMEFVEQIKNKDKI